MSDSKIVSVSISMKDGDVMIDPDIDTVSRFNEIYDSTNKYILAFITAKCGNISDVGDIFQETYMELYQLMTKRGASYVTGEKALVLKMAKQKIARHYTLLKRLKTFVSLTGKNEDNESVEAELSDTEIDSMLMEDCVVNQIMLENAQKYIEQKPIETKKIFYMFYNMGLSIPEIAEELALSESNVKNKLYRTIKELRNLLMKGGNPNETNES